jgi:hypothetical protein
MDRNDYIGDEYDVLAREEIKSGNEQTDTPVTPIGRPAGHTPLAERRRPMYEPKSFLMIHRWFFVVQCLELSITVTTLVKGLTLMKMLEVGNN